ncbi:MAG TPA: TlpA disulfide reductase family protein [Flavisolibacter sp.]|nr:TlpA disulfide reductase family protein [Flavisolibacter sp.]
MKKLLAILAFLPALLFAQPSQVKGFSIRGQVTGLADGEVKITNTQNNQAVVASGTSTGGVFELRGSIPEPGLYFLVMSNEQPQYIFLENTAITISGSREAIKGLKIEGSSSHLDFVEFNRIFNPLIGELNAIAAQIQKEMSAKKRDQLMGQYDSVAQRVNNEVGNFIAAKKSSYVSPFLLWVTSTVTPDIMQMEARYKMLDENIRNSGIGKSLSEYIASSKIGAVGTDAIDFTQADVNGKPVSLSSFKGKYVLVDFWASWCRPCRIENPNVVKVYNKFKDKNFTILGVSLDQQKEAWVKAINADGLAWSHVSDLKYWNNEAAQLYRIQSIPGNFLVDPNGKIVAKDLHGPELEKKLCEVIGGCQ